MSVVFAVVCAATKASSAAPMAAKMASDSAGGPRSCDAGGGGGAKTVSQSTGKRPKVGGGGGAKTVSQSLVKDGATDMYKSSSTRVQYDLFNLTLRTSLLGPPRTFAIPGCCRFYRVETMMNFVIEHLHTGSDVLFFSYARLLTTLPEASRPATTLTLA